MPLFNTSILTGSEQGQFAVVQFGGQEDSGSTGGSNIAGVVKPGSGGTVDSAGHTGAGNETLYDPFNLTGGSKQTTATGPFIYNDGFLYEYSLGSGQQISNVYFQMNPSNYGQQHRVTLIKTYDSFDAGIDKVSLVQRLTSNPSSGDTTYNNAVVIMDLLNRLGDSTNNITDLETTATFTPSSTFGYITMLQVGLPLQSSGSRRTTGTCRFKIELV
jgi:hypothetical protein|tara:strand:- start:2231 stop:2878 length:648 start_codon:yes stop_codon:yes gene_type:complete